MARFAFSSSGSRTRPNSRTIVFSRTKHGADKIVKYLSQCKISAAAIHGNKSQNFRERTLEQFKSSRPPVLVATDIAARGLDIKEVSHVVNYDLPETPETYVHRIGRTGRAGAEGSAVSFCTAEEIKYLRGIERLTRRRIEVGQGHDEYTLAAPRRQSTNRVHNADVAADRAAAAIVAVVPAAGQVDVPSAITRARNGSGNGGHAGNGASGGRPATGGGRRRPSTGGRPAAPARLEASHRRQACRQRADHARRPRPRRRQAAGAPAAAVAPSGARRSTSRL